jgi:hypothetical protein
LRTNPKPKGGTIDGLDARFAAIAPPKSDAKDPPKEPATAVHLVMVDAKTEVLIFQATLTMPFSKQESETCMAIIQSFKRE